MVIQFPLLCPLSLTSKLNFNMSKTLFLQISTEKRTTQYLHFDLKQPDSTQFKSFENRTTQQNCILPPPYLTYDCTANFHIGNYYNTKDREPVSLFARSLLDSHDSASNQISLFSEGGCQVSPDFGFLSSKFVSSLASLYYTSKLLTKAFQHHHYHHHPHHHFRLPGGVRLINKKDTMRKKSPNQGQR